MEGYKRYPRVNRYEELFTSEEWDFGEWFAGRDLNNLNEQDGKDFVRVLNTAEKKKYEEEKPLTKGEQQVLNAERNIINATALGATPLESAVVQEDGSVKIIIFGEER